MSEKEIYYCAYCGRECFPDSFPKRGYCLDCKSKMTPIKAQHDLSYYMDKAVEKFGESGLGRSDEIILEEAKLNPLFSEEKAKIARQTQNDRVLKKVFEKQIDANKPKCPTCGSTNISKLSATNRAVHGAVFGLFSKTARSQFECKHCGFKW